MYEVHFSAKCKLYEKAQSPLKAFALTLAVMRLTREFCISALWMSSTNRYSYRCRPSLKSLPILFTKSCSHTRTLFDHKGSIHGSSDIQSLNYLSIHAALHVAW